MAWYCDSSLLINTHYLVEAHWLNGAGEYDGMYLICCILSIGNTFQERSAIYATQVARDAAFVALGNVVTSAGDAPC